MTGFIRESGSLLHAVVICRWRSASDMYLLHTTARRAGSIPFPACQTV